MTDLELMILLADHLPELDVLVETPDGVRHEPLGTEVGAHQERPVLLLHVTPARAGVCTPPPEE